MVERSRPAPKIQKQPYSTPKLTVHGDLRAITTQKGGNRVESGQPKTFPATGMP